MSLRHRPARGPGDGPDDQGLEPALPAPVRRTGRARDHERDDRRPTAETAAQGRVRPYPPFRRRAILRRPAGRHQPRRNGMGGGVGRVPRGRSRGPQLRMPHRSLHPQGHRRVAGPPTKPAAAHHRDDEEGREGDSGHREDQAGLERRRPKCAGPGQGRGRRWRRRHHGARTNSQRALPDRGRLGCDRFHRGGGLDSRHRQRRRAVRTRSRAAARPCRLHRRDDRARGLDSSLAVSRSHRGIPRPVGGRSHRRSTAATSRWRRSIGGTTSTGWPACARSRYGTWGSGAAMSGVTTMARSRRCRCASGSCGRSRRSMRCSRAPTHQPTTT